MSEPNPPVRITASHPFMTELLAPPVYDYGVEEETIQVASPTHPPQQQGAGHQHLLAATGALAQPAPTRAPQPPAAAALRPRRVETPHEPAPAAAPRGDIDWALVTQHAQELQVDGADARTRADFDVAIAGDGPETAYEERALAEIVRIVDRFLTFLVEERGPDFAWPADRRAAHIQAVFDSAFRYGRLQQYLREPGVEDISIVGHDNVMVTLANGTREKRPAIASSNAELEAFISELASWRGRAFARPYGHVDLDLGGARMSATGASITSVANLTVRKHNHVDISLDDLVGFGTITPRLKEFLEAAVRANTSALIAGFPAAGKTTFLRAWMGGVPYDEKIVTIETERELYLNRLTHRHAQVQDFQYVPATHSSSDSVAGYGLEDAFRESLRSSAQRILFSEIRGPEGPLAMKAMQAGKGSVSTIHARSAQDTIHRLADALLAEQGLSDDTVPLRQIMRSIDLIVYLDTIPGPDGGRRRIVSEIAEVVPNDHQLPMAAQLFAWDHDLGGYVEPNEPSPELARLLRRHGLDVEAFWAGGLS